MVDRSRSSACRKRPASHGERLRPRAETPPAASFGQAAPNSSIWVKNDAILGGAEQELAYLAGLIGVVFLGPGRLSADEMMGNDAPLIDMGEERALDAIS